MTARGIRNHNPLNIRLGDDWNGMAKLQEDPSFCQFTGPEWGIRAASKILLSYKRRGICTVGELISRWAPPIENNTEAYITFVCDAAGYTEGQMVDLSNPVFIARILPPMIKMENGEMPYSVETIKKGVDLAYD